MSSQVEMVTLEELIPVNYIYRKLKELWDFTEIYKKVEFATVSYRAYPTRYQNTLLFSLITSS